jgi:hypothetical protein
MKATRRGVVAVLAGLIFWVPSTVVPAEPKDSQSPKRQPPSPARAATDPVYKPPPRGTPGGRVGGGTRGTRGRDIFVLSVLAPDHTGRTIHEQPSLFWFISTETSLPVELTIVDPDVVEPVLQTHIASPVERGVHRVRLAGHGVRLAPGVAYQWSVTVVPDATRRSHDILASGTIERVEAGGELATKLSEAARKIGLRCTRRPGSGTTHSRRCAI